jgi:hypothetical protein
VSAITRLGPISDQYLDSYPSTGFLLYNASDYKENSLGETYVILDYWKNPIREDEVRKGSGEVYQISVDPRHIVPQWFADEMKGLGCARFEIRHMRFTRLSKGMVELFSAHVVKCESLEYDWEEGKRTWALMKPMLEQGCAGLALRHERSKAKAKPQVLRPRPKASKSSQKACNTSDTTPHSACNENVQLCIRTSQKENQKPGSI